MDNMNMRFDLKKVNFLSSIKVIVCQNENGPCPLIALANALLLQNRIFIHPDNNVITLSDLIELIANCVMENSNHHHKSKSLEEQAALQSQQLLNEVLTTLPTLVNGLDLNVKFSGVSDFEFTRELSVFDALNISLYHGWVVDPQDTETFNLVRHMSYNQAVNKLVEFQERQSQNEKNKVTSSIVADDDNDLSSPYVFIDKLDSNNSITSEKPNDNKSKQDEEKDEIKEEICIKEEAISNCIKKKIDGNQHPQASVTITNNDNTTTTKTTDNINPVICHSIVFDAELELLKHQASLVQIFLTDTASQFTYEGLRQLHLAMSENQLAVFFRNNHFATLFKRQACLYLLVTDLGYKNVAQVVWEKVEDISSSDFVDEHFLAFIPLSNDQQFTPDLSHLSHIPDDDGDNNIIGHSAALSLSDESLIAHDLKMAGSNFSSSSSSSAVDNTFQSASPEQQQRQQQLLLSQQQRYDADRKAELNDLMRMADKGRDIDAVRLDFLLNTVQLDSDSADTHAVTGGTVSSIPQMSSSSSSSFSPPHHQGGKILPTASMNLPLRAGSHIPAGGGGIAASSSSSLTGAAIEDDFAMAMRLQREEEGRLDDLRWEQQQREQYQQYASHSSHPTGSVSSATSVATTAIPSSASSINGQPSSASSTVGSDEKKSSSSSNDGSSCTIS